MCLEKLNTFLHDAADCGMMLELINLLAEEVHLSVCITSQPH